MHSPIMKMKKNQQTVCMLAIVVCTILLAPIWIQLYQQQKQQVWLSNLINATVMNDMSTRKRRLKPLTEKSNLENNSTRLAFGVPLVNNYSSVYQHNCQENKCCETYVKTIDSNQRAQYVPGKTVMMEATSVRLVCSLLSDDKHVLEWGSGGSTHFFSQFTASWDAIEHDKTWAEIIRQQPLTNVHLHTTLVEWNANAQKDGTYKEFKNYVEFPKTLNRKWDVILIDGRARVACAQSVIRNRLLARQGVVIIHDWERTTYKQILQEYDIVSEDSHGPRHLGVLQPKIVVT